MTSITDETMPPQVEYSYGLTLGGHGDIAHLHEPTSRKALCGAGMYWAGVALRNRRICTRCRKMYDAGSSQGEKAAERS